ncbi:hypothetical protein DFJ74DRAFT_672806 [Hyaloraphidium curvatum]|nr:hypothetical protein DFJ74DRAFT_672806 [Hyaloraphidium curvatum]
MDVMLRAGEPASMLPLVQRAALIVDKLYLSMPPGFPPDAESWAIREMVLRLRIYVAAYDVGTASTTGKPTIGHYWHAHKFPIPATEAEFDSPDPEAAHMTAEARYDAGLEPTVDFGKSDYASISSAMRILAGAPFGGGGSVLSMLHLANYASHIRDSLLSSAPGPSGTDRRHKTAVQSALWDATTGALPPDICKGLARGDAGPLLRGWKAYFPDPAHAHAALQSFLLAKRAAIEVFARSGFVAAAVSRCSRFVRTLDSTIKHDPALPYCHSGLASPAAAVGRMLIDEARQLQDHPGPFETPEERTERERRKEELIMQARICCRVLGRLGAVYGLNLRQAAKGYHAEMVAAGWASATCPSASLNDLSEEEAEFRSDVGSHGHTEEFGGSTVLFAEEKMARGVVGAA